MLQVLIIYLVLVFLQFITSAIIARKLETNLKFIDYILLLFFSFICFPIVVVLLADLIWGKLNGRD